VFYYCYRSVTLIAPRTSRPLRPLVAKRDQIKLTIHDSQENQEDFSLMSVVFQRRLGRVCGCMFGPASAQPGTAGGKKFRLDAKLTVLAVCLERVEGVTVP
jgi:hypothetical protein